MSPNQSTKQTREQPPPLLCQQQRGSKGVGRGKNRLYYSTPDNEEKFKSDLRDAFVNGLIRLKPACHPDQWPVDFGISLSCTHTEDWMNLSKMGFYNSNVVCKIISTFLKDKCQFIGKSHTDIVESLHFLGLSGER